MRTLILGGALRAAERITAAHEEALYSLDETDQAYDELRAETARRVLHECDLRTVVSSVERDRATAAAPRVDVAATPRVSVEVPILRRVQ